MRFTSAELIDCAASTIELSVHYNPWGREIMHEYRLIHKYRPDGGLNWTTHEVTFVS